MILVFVILLFLPGKQINARVVGGLVIPHGDFAFDPSLLPQGSKSRQAAQQVAAAARQAGNWISTLEPDVIFLSSPHGQELNRDFAVYLNSWASGYADIGSDLHNGTSYRIQYPQRRLAPELAGDLLSTLDGCNVTGILNFGDSEDSPLRWAEVIPLLMIPATNRSLLLVWSHPLRRYNSSVSMIPELLSIGGHIYNWMEPRPERIAVVISADLSHTHLPDGPYGYSEASAKFDRAVGKWAMDPRRFEESLLKEADFYQPKALSCGFTGLVLLHGILAASGFDFEPHIWANANATYYGMMVATFRRKDQPTALK
jgi:aromatic ring-opening dioxygenase LigB subunit